MKFTDKDKHRIRTLIVEGRHTRVNVITDDDVTEPYMKGDDLYLPEYDSYQNMFEGIEGVKCFDLTSMSFKANRWLGMFANCEDLETVLFSGVFVEYTYVDAEEMFLDCPHLKMVDLSSFFIDYFDATNILGTDTNVTKLYMPAVNECTEAIPYKDIRIYMDDSAYLGPLNEFIYGEHKGQGPTFVIPQKAWARMEPWQYEHLTDGYTIEIVE